MSQDEDNLIQALVEAEKGRGFCAPNPAVGAILIKNGRPLSKGFHRGPGTDHAEVDAIKNSAESVEGATLYVTLEPCCHIGKRTPPCTDLLIQKKIGEVIYAYADPNPEVSGKGEETMREAGIVCRKQTIEPISEFYRSYEYFVKNKKTFLTYKIAVSHDGKTAAENGKRFQISGDLLNQFTHLQRKRADAILTTAETVIVDDPLLNARVADSEVAKKVYILDSNKRIKGNEKIFSKALEVILMQEKIDLKATLLEIANDGIIDLWVEAGGTLLQSFLKEGLLNRLYFYLCDKKIGEKGLGLPDFEILKNSKKMKWEKKGKDLLGTMDF